MRWLCVETDSSEDGVGSSLFQTLLDWVLGLENLRQFLQSTILGLWEEEVHDDPLNEVPGNEYEVEVVANGVEAGSNAVVADSSAGLNLLLA